MSSRYTAFNQVDSKPSDSEENWFQEFPYDHSVKCIAALGLNHDSPGAEK